VDVGGRGGRVELRDLGVGSPEHTLLAKNDGPMSYTWPAR